MLLHYIGKIKRLKFAANIEQTANKMHWFDKVKADYNPRSLRGYFLTHPVVIVELIRCIARVDIGLGRYSTLFYLQSQKCSLYYLTERFLTRRSAIWKTNITDQLHRYITAAINQAYLAPDSASHTPPNLVGQYYCYYHSRMRRSNAFVSASLCLVRVLTFIPLDL